MLSSDLPENGFWNENVYADDTNTPEFEESNIVDDSELPEDRFHPDYYGDIDYNEAYFEQ